MNNLPYGWSEQYAIRAAIERTDRMTAAINALTQRVSELEAEVARLDIQKANKSGRPPKSKSTAQD